MIKGILYACQYLVITRDEPTFAEEIMRESGYGRNEYLKEQKSSQFESRKMNKIINLAFDYVKR